MYLLRLRGQIPQHMISPSMISSQQCFFTENASTQDSPYSLGILWNFAENLKAIVILENQIGVIFLWPNIQHRVRHKETSNFMGLSTLSLNNFVSFGQFFLYWEPHFSNRPLPPDVIPQLYPTTAMSDWEIGARNARKKNILPRS